LLRAVELREVALDTTEAPSRRDTISGLDDLTAAVQAALSYAAPLLLLKINETG